MKFTSTNSLPIPAILNTAYTPINALIIMNIFLIKINSKNLNYKKEWFFLPVRQIRVGKKKKK
jgi:hypothetical protein